MMMAALPEESSAPAERPDLTYHAPVLSVDLTPWQEDGTPLETWPCTDCLPWHIEVITDEDDEVWVREWHAAQCPTLIELLAICSAADD